MLDSIITPMRVAAALKGWHLADETIEEVRRILEGDPAVKESSPELKDNYMVKETREAQISYVPVTAEHITAVPVSAGITGKCQRHNYVDKYIGMGMWTEQCSFCKEWRVR